MDNKRFASVASLADIKLHYEGASSMTEDHEQTLLEEFIEVPIDNRRVSIFAFQKKKVKIE